MRVDLGRDSAPNEAQPGSAEKDADLAVKLNRLFEIMRKPNEPPLSNAAAADAITKATGVSISSAYIWQLRNGIKTNPTVQHLRAIADFFWCAGLLFDRSRH